SAGPGERVRRVGCHLRARTGGPPAPRSLLLCLAPANLAALLGVPLSFPVGGALYVVQNQGVHVAPRRGRADPIGAATDTLAPGGGAVTSFSVASARLCNPVRSTVGRWPPASCCCAGLTWAALPSGWPICAGG